MMFLHKKKLRKQIEVTLQKKRVNLISYLDNTNKEGMFLRKKKLRGIKVALKRRGWINSDALGEIQCYLYEEIYKYTPVFLG